jgi:transcriptional regulator with XRE-family HTH domain
MKDLKTRIAEKFNDKNFEKKYHRTTALYRLADQVLLLRKQRGLTQKELSEKVGTTQAVISRLESASVKPSLETILNIAEALDAAVEVRLLPVELLARKTALPGAEEKKQDLRRGLVYFDQDQSSPSQDEKWITPQNAPIEKLSAKRPAPALALKRKIREYA